jgi:signal transduction histidine kinase
MTFADALSILIVNIFNLFPIVLLCYLPFRKKLTKPLSAILAQMGIVCVSFILLSISADIFGIYGSGDIVATLFVVVGYFYFRKTVTAEHQKRNFIFCIGIYTGGTAHGIGHIFWMIGVSERLTELQAAIITITTYIVVYTIIGIILQRYIAGRMEHVKARDMNLLWLIPFLFSILTYFYIVSHNMIGVVDAVYPVVFSMLTVISFVVFAMVVRMLERAGINAQTELELAIEKEQRRNLQDENETLDRLSRMKSEYMANMTHEAKTPLTVISVHVQQAREIFEEMAFQSTKHKLQSTNEVEGANDPLNADELTADGETIINSLRRAQEEIMRVSRIINHNLWTASEQEVIHKMKPLDISEIITDTSEKYRDIAKIQGNTLNISTQPSLPQIFGNDDQLVQVLNNLLTNAVNHTKNGVIEVKAQITKHKAQMRDSTDVRDGTDHIQVTIADNGTGIPSELLPHVFERGVTGSADKGGTGMGLSISQNIIRTHGGEITINSTHGKGTAVTFTLPVHGKSTKHKAQSTNYKAQMEVK